LLLFTAANPSNPALIFANMVKRQWPKKTKIFFF
jgi:hypothetical protein